MESSKKASHNVLQGISAAPGLANGPAYCFSILDVEIPHYQHNNPQAEIDRLETAIQMVKSSLQELALKTEQEAGAKEAAVFEAHQMFLEDSALLNKTNKKIQEGTNAEAAWCGAIEYFATQLDSLPDPTLKARAVDIRDVGRQVLFKLCGVADDPSANLVIPSIILARDLTPSETAHLEKSLVLGFCTVEGGPTSHTAILAKALGLPAVVGLDEHLLELENGTPMLLDGQTGVVISNPTSEQIAAFEKRRSLLMTQIRFDQAAAHEPAITRDHHRVAVVANIGAVLDAEEAIQAGAEGVGLFRTEFVYMNRVQMPSENEQITLYRQVLAPMKGKPVVVRTLDIGGDKALEYLGLQTEANPFLGWRAIRMMSERPDILKSQYRALLQAGIDVDLRIMVPLISNLDEIRMARQVFEEARQELAAENIASTQKVQFGMMVEVPSAALLADVFAKEVDFFSIGTNDLTQYTLAVDRTNNRVARLASPFNPAVLKLMDITIQAAHRHGKWCGLCGEMAGDEMAIPILIGLGLDEFSMAPSRIPEAKRIIRSLSAQDCKAISSQVLKLESAQAVTEYLTKIFNKNN